MDSAVGGNLQGLDLTVDIRTVLSKEYFEKELAGIFRRAWLPIGHNYSIPRPGDYFVRKLPGLETALLIVRGTDGPVRAFHNICRHRGSPLVTEPGGNQKGLPAQPQSRSSLASQFAQFCVFLADDWT
jgi:phenylpropionate dioxygenase-like ring-hydroxylating dioxygenase large terminal subunit